MSDLIRRDEALKAIVDERTHTLLQAWINVKKTVPSVDAIEVVRCKDCEYIRIYDGETKYYYCALEDRPNRQWSVDETDYCSWGERKEKCKECWYWSEVHQHCENKGGCQFKPYGEREGK